MLKIATKEEIQQYREDKSLNQSLLKELSVSPRAFLKARDEEHRDTESFIIGSAVDTLLTGNTFIDDFLVSSLDRSITDNIKIIVDNIYDEVKRGTPVWDEIGSLDSYKAQIGSVLESVDFYANRKLEWKIDHILEKGTEYFEHLKSSANKRILSQNAFQVVTAVVNSLGTSPISSKFFDRPFLQEEENTTTYYQLPIYFTFADVKCKALPDIIKVYRKDEKILISVFDLKTTARETIHFVDSFVKYKYYYQAAWYMEAIYDLESSFWKSIGIDPTDHTLKITYDTFRFIVESTTYPGVPLLYHTTKELIQEVSMGNYFPFTLWGMANMFKYHEKNGYDTPYNAHVYGSDIPIFLTDLQTKKWLSE